MKSYLLNSAVVADLLQDAPIVIIDGGARGGLFPPFDLVTDKVLRVIRCEPDPEAEIAQNQERDIVVNKALWSSNGKQKLNVAVAPSASSMLPFNRSLQQYIDPSFATRKTDRQVEVETVNVDTLVSSGVIPQVDFIKLDVHGAEYEVLAGATETLSNTLGLLVESWIIPIHKGQKTRAAVEQLAYENKFYVFEEYPMAEWVRGGAAYGKRQPVAIDTLFFKDPLLNDDVTTLSQAVKLIGIADLFGHHVYAKQLTHHFSEQGILTQKWVTTIDAVVKANSRPSLKEKLRFKYAQALKGYLSSAMFR